MPRKMNSNGKTSFTLDSMFKESGEIKVTKQVIVPFSIGKYSDEVLCDVVSMHFGYLLLWRPWQYNWRVVHDGYTNCYSFKHNKKAITLAPMTPKQVYKDQILLKEENEKTKSKEKEKNDESEKEKRNKKKKKEFKVKSKETKKKKEKEIEKVSFYVNERD
ncbi:hypothetical protein PVK06_047806 [Gossypium arboreum]|uniref:Uncharacterized protein n=1 Tax=Gossypium arboreum TaxID=29729 RepID=A0ABR0MER5_GOSAR|nr:hypothetical protein PVK06_047806 [Gossypium arboreum]